MRVNNTVHTASGVGKRSVSNPATLPSKKTRALGGGLQAHRTNGADGYREAI